MRWTSKKDITSYSSAPICWPSWTLIGSNNCRRKLTVQAIFSGGTFIRIPGYFSKLKGAIRHSRWALITRSTTRPVRLSVTSGTENGSDFGSPPSSDPLESSSDPAGTGAARSTGDSLKFWFKFERNDDWCITLGPGQWSNNAANRTQLIGLTFLLAMTVYLERDRLMSLSERSVRHLWTLEWRIWFVRILSVRYFSLEETMPI